MVGVMSERGASWPLEAMLGVEISRDNRIEQRDCMCLNACSVG
jgi:hypothetical protein